MEVLTMKTKIIFFSLLFTLFICIISTNIFAYSSLTNYKPTYGTLTTNVNFRTTASTSTGKIKTLSKGTSIKMVGTIDSFYIAQLSTNEIGVVSKSYVKASSSAPKGAKVYTAITKKTGTTQSKTILRGGPGTNFRKIATLNAKTKVTIIGYIENWYVVVTNNDQIGCIRKDLLSTSSSNSTTGTSTSTTTSFSMSTDEKIIFDLINNARTKAGISKLTTDSNVFKVARLKSQDMVKNSYFSHTSPTYGSPFQMLKTYGVSYKVAGENIAGNPSLEAAVNAWLDSTTHKQNILSNSYNYIGIGVEKSNTYGYIISAMFVRKIDVKITSRKIY